MCILDFDSSFLSLSLSLFHSLLLSLSPSLPLSPPLSVTRPRTVLCMSHLHIVFDIAYENYKQGPNYVYERVDMYKCTHTVSARRLGQVTSHPVYTYDLCPMCSALVGLDSPSLSLSIALSLLYLFRALSLILLCFFVSPECVHAWMF